MNTSTHLREVVNPAPDRYGVVTVRDQSGAIDREFVITGEELATLHKSGNGVPPGVTREDWESGRARVIGKSREQGEYQRQGETLAMTVRAELRRGRWVETVAEFAAGEWTDHGDGTVSVAPAVLTALNQRTTRRTTVDFVSLERNVLVTVEP
jgi:hypothetical protein